jgi:serine/threonine-protein kinase HipA
MTPFRLIETPAKRRLFATRRFDYADGKRLHLHSLAGLLHDNFRYTNLDYGHLMDAAFKLERNTAAIVQVFRRAAFNILANNRDDHSKNFAFLMDERGSWQLSPAYDLTWSTTAHGEHSMTIAGEGKSPSIADLLRLADQFDIDRAHAVIDEVKIALAQWPALRNELGIHSYPLFRH